MKNKIITLGVGSAIISSSVLSSCEDTDENLSSNTLRAKQNLALPNSSAISIKALSKHDKKYMHDIGILYTKILNDEHAAEQFLKSPSEYAKSLGLTSSINLDDGSIRFLLAICKPEFKEAIEKRDIRRFVTLCEENNIFKNSVSSNIKLLKNTDIDYYMDGTDKIDMGFFWLGEWIVVAVISVGVGIDFETMGLPSTAANKAIDSEMALQFWNYKTKGDSIYEITAEYKNQYIKDLFDLIIEKHPEVLEHYSKKELIAILQKYIKF